MRKKYQKVSDLTGYVPHKIDEDIARWDSLRYSPNALQAFYYSQASVCGVKRKAHEGFRRGLASVV